MEKKIFFTALAFALLLAGCIQTQAPEKTGLAVHSMGHDSMPEAKEVDFNVEKHSQRRQINYTVKNGTKEFVVVAKPIKWEIQPFNDVYSWAYNGQVPGPEIRVVEGDRVRIVLKNELPESTTIHFHGVELPNSMDGVPGLTQDPVQPNGTFVYEFTANHAGSFMYHSHTNTQKQVELGLYGPFMVEPKNYAKPDKEFVLMLSELSLSSNGTNNALFGHVHENQFNYYLINGKVFPATEELSVRQNDSVKIRLMNIGSMSHPVHLHGHSFKIIATDGNDYDGPVKDTLSIAPGERYDVLFNATNPGNWMLHCHVFGHSTNDGETPGGMMTTVAYEK